MKVTLPCPGDRAKPQLLIITADDGVRWQLAELLQGPLFRVTVAGDVPSVAEFIDTGSVEVLLLDTQLPDDAGLKLCRRLRRRGTRLPLIMFSSHPADDSIPGLDAGADDYLVHPFRGPEIIARLRSLLLRRRPEPGVIRAYPHADAACAALSDRHESDIAHDS